MHVLHTLSIIYALLACEVHVNLYYQEYIIKAIYYYTLDIMYMERISVHKSYRFA